MGWISWYCYLVDFRSEAVVVVAALQIFCLLTSTEVSGLREDNYSEQKGLLLLFVLSVQEADTSRQRKKETPIYHNVWKAILYPFNLCFFHLGSYQLAKATIQWPNIL